MGKYMKKSKTAGDVAVFMDVSPHTSSSSLGVRTRTRANTLKSPFSSPQIPDASSYLQLRSRRLPKLLLPQTKVTVKCCRETALANSRLREGSAKTVSSSLSSGQKLGPFCVEEENVDVGFEGSFGENFFEVEGKDRSTRESTPCSSIRDSNAIHTPGSTTRQGTHQITHEHMQRNIPTAYEMEEFFAYAEKQQQTIFMDKYNFDIVNDVPLPGQYEWVPVLLHKDIWPPTSQLISSRAIKTSNLTTSSFS